MTRTCPLSSVPCHPLSSLKPKDRLKIASEIYDDAMRWDDEIYLYLNDNRSTGLFEHGFFESDIQKAFRLLKKIIEK